jgi:D-beta-D-heptose 7-phosphate kinase / D-beta-D-heptose 1-phosphate adenosyltransferase
MSRSVVVIGESLLDVDVVTTAERLSPDGAAPVLDEVRRDERAGGAALAARLVAELDPDVRVTLVTPMADDAAAGRLAGLVVDRVRLLTLPCTGATSVKTRLRTGTQTVARLDQGSGRLGGVSLPSEVRAAVARADAVLVADYGRGLTGDAQLRELVAAAAAHVPVVWDPHPRGTPPVPGVTLGTPNAREAAAYLDVAASDDVATACRAAGALAQAWSARAVAVTLGPSGAVLSHGADLIVVPAAAVADADACGAGDCFAAAVTLALLGGGLLSEAVGGGVAAATDFVARGGVASLGRRRDRSEPAREALPLILDRVRAGGGSVVATGGCFDLIHAGHVATLTAARGLGDFLVVCVNSDASVRRLKGPLRPLQREADRVRVLEAMRCVDAVVVFDEDTPERVLTDIRPALWVKGGDYAGADLPEAPVLARWGGQAVAVPYLPGHSTSDLLELARR